MRKRQTGFTIIELLIVIVVVGILAAVSVVAYKGVQGRAMASVLKSELSQATRQLAAYHAEHGVYPSALVCPAGDGEICISSDSGAAFRYYPDLTASPPTYRLVASNNNLF